LGDGFGKYDGLGKGQVWGRKEVGEEGDGLGMEMGLRRETG